MSRPTYTYKGFQLWSVCLGLYEIVRRGETYTYLEKAPKSRGGGYVAITPTVQSKYAELSQRIERGEYAGRNARDAFQRWVDENYGNAYAHKN